MQFKSEPAVSKELERQLKLHEDVLRGLVVRLDAKMLTHMAALAAAAPPRPRPAMKLGSLSATSVPYC